ncbi:MAG: hypothetical protein GF364_18455 [Candidatus Lokiarchaeota archaeon]|nr:hypothetical protein [Candidatus Lokiarchaeota archaeon]
MAGIPRYEFFKFGEYIEYCGAIEVISIAKFLFSVLSFTGTSLMLNSVLNSMISIAELVILIMILIQVRRINKYIHYPHLDDFIRFKTIAFVFLLFSPIFSYAYLLPIDLLLILVLLVITIFSGIISMIFEYKAWNRMLKFFSATRKAFPGNIGYNAKKNAERIKKGTICELLGFLLIPLIIAPIYYVMGYFGLGNALTSLKPAKMAKSHQVEEQPDLNDELSFPTLYYQNSEPKLNNKSIGDNRNAEYSGLSGSFSSNISAYKKSKSGGIGNKSSKQCPNCGTNLTGKELNCPICGAWLGGK